MSENATPFDPQATDPGAPPSKTPPRRSPKTPRVTKKGGGRKASKTSSAPVLGVHVTPQTVYAVLIRQTGLGFEPIRQFSRQRSLGAENAAAEMAPLAMELATPESVPVADDGITIQFGSGSGGGDSLFLDSEFAGMGLDDVSVDAASPATPRRTGSPIVFELKDILEECRVAGFEKPGLSFVIGTPDVDYVEITVPADGDKKKDARKADPKKAEARKAKAAKESKKAETDAKGVSTPVKRDRLMALLPKTDAAYDKERVAFIPMTPRENLRRYLAVLPRPEEPVVDSLELLREQQGMRRVPFRGISAEVPVLIGMARMAFPTDPHENTALVRVGAEDTLVVLLQGDQLHHCDHMRSVTTFDGPDTICSRVLLQQDVQGIGTVHNVIVVSEEREDELVQGFAAFYPEARVETLRAGIAKVGVAGPYGPLPTQAMEAAGVALKALIRKESPFEDVELLPKQLRHGGKRLDFSFSWHTLVVTVLLFMSVLFFVGLYFKQNSDIAEAERRLAEYPPQASMSGTELQYRIDSLRMAQQQITTSLNVLDSLLYGSDQWSQTLARMNTAAAGVGGMWAESWQPESEDILLTGYATSRDRIVQLATRLNASIEEATFQEIREFPVYSYRLRFPLPFELPATVRYLREQAGETIPPPPARPEPLAGSIPLNPPPAQPPPPSPPAEEAPAEAADPAAEQ
jgi:hypothetical protein